MLARSASATLVGVQGAPIWVEVHVSRGLPLSRSSDYQTPLVERLATGSGPRCSRAGCRGRSSG